MEEKTEQNLNQPITNTGNTVLQNSTAVLVLGILSIVLCWCYGIVGLALGIIALTLSSKSLKILAASPQEYSQGSVKNLKAGRTCAIIGTVLSGVYVIWVIIYISFMGAIISMLPWKSLMDSF